MIQVKIHTRCQSNEIKSHENGIFSIGITAAPQKGKANHALIEYLSDLLKISKTSIRIKKGLTSPYKLIEIDNLSNEQVNQILLKQVKSP